MDNLRKFRMGNRVRAKHHNPVYNGHTGTVVGFAGDISNVYKVKWDRPIADWGRIVGYSEDYLVPLHPQSPFEAKVQDYINRELSNG